MSLEEEVTLTKLTTNMGTRGQDHSSSSSSNSTTKPSCCSNRLHDTMCWQLMHVPISLFVTFLFIKKPSKTKKACVLDACARKCI